MLKKYIKDLWLGPKGPTDWAEGPKELEKGCGASYFSSAKWSVILKKCIFCYKFIEKFQWEFQFKLHDSWKIKEMWYSSKEHPL